MGRGVFTGCGLDRHGSDLGPVRRRGSHPAGLHPERLAGRADRGNGRAGNVEFELLHVDSPPERGSRPSRPFTEEDWAAGRSSLHISIDADLEAQDVRLTMGGEPTFVGIDDPESPEWNIDALGR